MPQIVCELTRLECRELLAHLDGDCDPDVIAKLVQGSQTGARAEFKVTNDYSEIEKRLGVPSLDAMREANKRLPDLQQTVKDVAQLDGDTFLTGVDDPRVIYANEKIRAAIIASYPEATNEQIAPFLWDEAAVEKANHERKLVMQSQERMKLRKPNLNQFDAPNADFAPPDVPPMFGIERIAVGEANSAGDKCIAITPENISVFQCSKGHVYYGNNPATKGCSTCEMSGGGTTVATITDDEEEQDEPRSNYEQF